MKNSILKRVGLVILSLSLLSGVVLAAPNTPAHVDGKMTAVSVVHQGAVGNGYTDDTAAFKRAVEAAKAADVPMFIPGGTYVISDTVDLSGVDVVGDPNAAWPADGDSLPIVQMTNPEVPLFTIQDGSISGIKIHVKSLASNRNKFSECIRIIGSNVLIKNMKLDNVTSGIKTFGLGFSGIVIENVFMPSTHKVGVQVAGTTGTILKNIEMWTPTQVESDFPAGGVGIQMINNKDLYLEGCFVFNAAVGFKFVESPDGGNSAVLDNCTVDLTGIGAVVTGTHQLKFVGGTYWTHASGIVVEGGGQSEIDINGVELRSNGDAALKIAGGKRTTVKGCLIRRSMDTRTVSTVVINGTPGDVTIDGCMIYCNMTGSASAVNWGNPTNLVFTNNIINTNANGYPEEAPEGSVVKNNLVASYSLALEE